jgi:hypothetical protein
VNLALSVFLRDVPFLLRYTVSNKIKSKRVNFYLVAIICPRAELHVTVLLVEGEPLHVDLAGGLVDRRRLPNHLASVTQAGFGHQGHLVLPVGTKNKSLFIS